MPGEARKEAAEGQNVIEVAAGLVFRGGRLLITQRRAGDHLGGLWEFPGGKRHAVETFESCLRRELLEEVGIEVEVAELLECVDHRYPDKRVHLQFYRCRLLAGEPHAIGCQAFAWVTREELCRYAFPAADTVLLKTLTATADLWR
jgi:mutator protein MutT